MKKLYKQASDELNKALLKKLAAAVDTMDDLRAEIVSTIAEDPPALLKDGGYIRGNGQYVRISYITLDNGKNVILRIEAPILE